MGITCPDCGEELSTGGGHGAHGLWIRYAYCDKCDRFVSWQSSPMSETQKQAQQELCRKLLKLEKQ